MKRKFISFIVILIVIASISGCVDNLENSTNEITVNDAELQNETAQDFVERFCIAITTNNLKNPSEFLEDSISEKDANTVNVGATMQNGIEEVLSEQTNFKKKTQTSIAKNILRAVLGEDAYKILSCEEIGTDDYVVRVKFTFRFPDLEKTYGPLYTDEELYGALGVSTGAEFLSTLKRRSGLSMEKLSDLISSSSYMQQQRLMTEWFEPELSEIIEKDMVEECKNASPKTIDLAFCTHRKVGKWKIYSLKDPQAVQDSANNEEQASFATPSNENIDITYNGSAQDYLDDYKLNTEKFNEVTVTNLSQEDLRCLINALYAYHGYTFETDGYRRFFLNKSWYNPSDKSMEQCEAEFNDCERANKEVFTAREQAMGWR